MAYISGEIPGKYDHEYLRSWNMGITDQKAILRFSIP